MKMLSQITNLMLIACLLLLKSYESFILALVFVIMVIINFVSNFWSLKEELIKPSILSSVVIILLFLLLSYFLFMFYKELELNIAKAAIIIYELSLIILLIRSFLVKRNSLK